MNRLAIRLLTVAIGWLAGGLASGQTIDWVVDRNLSFIDVQVPDQVVSVSGTNVAIQFRNQIGAEPSWNLGNSAPLGGWIQSTYDETSSTVQFNSAALHAPHTGNYRPDYPNFDEVAYQSGTASAVFGGKVRLMIPFTPTDAGFFSMTNATLGLETNALSMTSSGTSHNFSVGVGDLAAEWSSLRMHLDGLVMPFVGQPLPDFRGLNLEGEFGTATGGSGTTDSVGAIPAGFDRIMSLAVPMSAVLNIGTVPVAANATMNLVAYANVAAPGSTQSNPIIPDLIVPGEPWLFTEVISNQWYDPPLTEAFAFEMVSDSLFTGITGLPTGFDAPFTVSVGDIKLGTFTDASQVVFSSYVDELGDLLIDEVGVERFVISRIRPGADIEDPTAFPVRLAFNTLTASFTMTPVPEPSSFVLGALALVAVLAWRRTTQRAI